MLDRIREQVGAGRLTLASGCEFQLTYENMDLLHRDPRPYEINGGRQFLIELSDFGIPPHLEEWLDDFQALGLTPIISHPERNSLVQAKVGRIAEWISAGVLVQLTGGTLLDRFGTKAEEAAHALIEKGLLT